MVRARSWSVVLAKSFFVNKAKVMIIYEMHVWCACCWAHIGGNFVKSQSLKYRRVTWKQYLPPSSGEIRNFEKFF